MLSLQYLPITTAFSANKESNTPSIHWNQWKATINHTDLSIPLVLLHIIIHKYN